MNNYNLKPKLYEKLIEEYNFNKVIKSQFPGSIGGVVNEVGIEICGVQHNDGLRIDVMLPINAEQDELFGLYRCANKYFLGNKEFILANENTLDKCIEQIIKLTNHGINLVNSNKNKHISYQKDTQ